MNTDQKTFSSESSSSDGFLDSASLLTENNYALFFNRELSWLKFNERVLEEAAREDNPALERLKFLAITESNLNEFFMVRVSGLKQVEASSVRELQMDGRTPRQTLEEISKQVKRMTSEQHRIFENIIEELSRHNIHILTDFHQIYEDEQEFVHKFFTHEIFPVLTPLAIDPSHPFPHILSGTLNQAIHLRRVSDDKSSDIFAILEVPSIFPRFLELPSRTTQEGEKVFRFIPLEEIIKLHAKELFGGAEVLSIHGFSIIRNTELYIDEVASENLLSTMEAELKNRRWGEAMRINTRFGMPDTLREFLRVKLDLFPEEVYERPFILNLESLMEIYSKVGDAPALRDVPYIPRMAVVIPRPDQIFSMIRSKDIFLHHPYDSFSTVLEIMEFASRDPKVLAIKQTLYRTSGDSPVVQSLIQAAENGKQVTALVELKARFDEKNNIVWAREMEKHGVHVVYGLVGLKIHGKMLQIVRREPDGVRSYVHLSTGNYNPNTAKLYTDCAIITADPIINADVTNLFHSMTGYAAAPSLEKISAAPINLRETIEELIKNEIQFAKEGKSARIRLKLNAIVDPGIILLLYEASRAGVKIEASVRGICCLRPGIPGISDNIRIESIVGRFLEHSRIFYFENGGNHRVYFSSADWMPRNLNRRVEILFPIEDPEHVRRCMDMLDAVFTDNHNSRKLESDGSYTRLQPASEDSRFSVQRYFREEVNRQFEQSEKERVVQRKLIFQPLNSPNSGDAPDDDSLLIKRDIDEHKS